MFSWDWQTIKNQIADDARVPLAINLVCAILVIIILLQAYFSFRAIGPLQTPAPRAVTTATQLHHITRLSDLHLFGIYDKSLAKLPETQLPLTLNGTMVSAISSKYSYALISAQGGKMKIYHIGDALPGGSATLKAVHNNYVILDINGDLQILRIPIPKLTDN